MFGWDNFRIFFSSKVYSSKKKKIKVISAILLPLHRTRSHFSTSRRCLLTRQARQKKQIKKDRKLSGKEPKN